MPYFLNAASIRKGERIAVTGVHASLSRIGVQRPRP